MTQPIMPPSGTVTLLFTDVQGSTRLWEAEPEPMAVALRRHDEILRGSIERASGYVFKTVGDAFCAAFSTAGQALAAVLDSQQALGTETWPTSRPILVRMGLHSGTTEERDHDYFGPVVNRAARLEAAAHGGQVLVSGATAELLAGRLPEGVTLRDLGSHRLKDLGRPEQVYQLAAEFLAASFPPIRSLDNPELPNNLPSLPSAFVGRDRELAEVRALIWSSRLVTLTGAGGSGKTRLALQAAAEQVGGDGVWLAELAPLTDGGQIAGAVAAAIGLQDQGAAPMTDVVTQTLTGQDVLILLDNCEHLIDAAAKFCDHVIRHCPKVRFLITSREPLGIDGEHVYRVPSMSLPDPDAESVGDLTASDAIWLFAERARTHQPSFTIDEHSAALAATICRRLDGIPLALELAAARLSSMSLAQVAARLDQRFRLLTGGSRNAMPRQQTLQATVDWSFSLLTPAERDMLTHLSVFAGGFELEAAEAVCATDTIDVLDVLDLLGSLVDKSLVVADYAADSVRYRLLETIRQYSAQELLRAVGDDEVMRVRSRHADYFLRLAETLATALTGPEQGAVLRRLDGEWDNLRATFGHLAAEDRADDIFWLSFWLNRFFLSRGHAEVLKYVRPIADRDDLPPSSALAEGLVMTSTLLWMLLRTDAGERAAATAYAERALAVARGIGDRRAEAYALAKLAESEVVDGDIAAARPLAEQGVAIARELGDVQMLGEQLQVLAYSAQSAEEIRRILLENLDCCRQSGDDLVKMSVLTKLFSLDLHAERIEESVAYLEEAAAISERLGGDLILLFMRCNIALVRLVQGRYEEAVPLVRTCLLMSRRIGQDVGTGEVFFAAACCTGWQGDHLRAARLHGAGDADIKASLENRTINWSSSEEQLREREQGRLREVMGDAAFEEAYRFGTSLTIPQAMDLALGRDAAH